MKLLASTKIKITKNKNGENILDLKIAEAVLVQCNTVDYHQDSRVLYTFLPNKSLLHNAPKNFVFFKNLYFKIFIY